LQYINCTSCDAFRLTSYALLLPRGAERPFEAGTVVCIATAVFWSGRRRRLGARCGCPACTTRRSCTRPKRWSASWPAMPARSWNTPNSALPPRPPITSLHLRVVLSCADSSSEGALSAGVAV
jgi:hypothetical protein